MLNKSPMEIAKIIVNCINNKSISIIDKIDFVSPGFINIKINTSFLIKELPTIIKQNEAFGRNKTGNNKIALVEL